MEESGIEGIVVSYQEALKHKDLPAAADLARAIGDTIRENAGDDVHALDDAITWHQKELQCWSQAKTAAGKTGNAYGMAGALRFIGVCLCIQGKYKDAIHHHLKALKLARQCGSAFEEANCLMNLGWIRMAKYKSIQDSEGDDSSDGEGEGSTDRTKTKKDSTDSDVEGNPDLFFGYYEKAREVAEDCLRTLRRKQENTTEIRNLLADLHYQYGFDLEYLNRFQQAYEEHFKAVPQIGEDDSYRLCRAYLSIGTCLHKLGKTDKALCNLKRARDSAVRKQDKLSASMELGKYYLQENKFKEAVLHFQSMEKYAQVLGDQESISSARVLLSNVAQKERESLRRKSSREGDTTESSNTQAHKLTDGEESEEVSPSKLLRKRKRIEVNEDLASSDEPAQPSPKQKAVEENKQPVVVSRLRVDVLGRNLWVPMHSQPPQGKSVPDDYGTVGWLRKQVESRYSRISKTKTEVECLMFEDAILDDEDMVRDAVPDETAQLTAVLKQHNEDH